MKAKKKDGRVNNGPEDRGLTEDSQLVRGPKALLEMMRKLARERGAKISELWRQAAEEFLSRQ
jgi:hypothetical protein